MPTINAITKEKVAELYEEAARNLKNAQELIGEHKTLSDEQKTQYDAWMANVDEIKDRAERAEKLMSTEAELSAKQAEQKLAQEKATNEQKIREAGFEHGWQYLKAIYDFMIDGVRDPRLEKLQNTKDMSGETGITGGFLLPTQQNQEILATRGEASEIRNRGRVVPMGARTVDFPAVDYSKGEAGKSAFFGGVQTYYVEESKEIDESEPKFKTVELKAKEIAGYVEIPNSLLRDSPISLEAFLQGPGSFGGALAWQEDYDSLRGAGAGKLLGILNSPAAISTSRKTASKFQFEDAVTMASRMILSGSPIWQISQSVMPQLYQMVDSNGNNIWQGSAAVGKPDTLLGWPIKWTEKLPALGTKGDVCLVDLSWYLLGDRQAVTMDVSREHRFRSNQTAFRVIEAVDGKPWLDAPITLADGATTVSPFVLLD